MALPPLVGFMLTCMHGKPKGGDLLQMGPELVAEDCGNTEVDCCCVEVGGGGVTVD